MGFFGAAHGWGGGGQKGRPTQKSHTSYNDETWHSNTLPKEVPETI